MKSRVIIVLLFLTAFSAKAQDLTGIWRGYFGKVIYTRDENGKRMAVPSERYKFEVQVEQKRSYLGGVTYSYLSTVFYGKASAAGSFNKQTSFVSLDEVRLIEVRMVGLEETCIMKCNLRYKKNGEEEFLEGTYVSYNTKDSSDCGKGNVFLRKVITSDFYKEPFLTRRENEKATPPAVSVSPTPAPKQPVEAPKEVAKKPAPAPQKKNTPQKSTPPPVKQDPPKLEVRPSAAPKLLQADSGKKNIESKKIVVVPKVIATRENEVVKTVTTNANKISIRIYDNGTIDNDTISVYLDKKLVISKQRLTEKAIQLTLELDDSNDFHELVMVAENLGEIPPNTSLMVVTAGSKEYEIRVTSNEQKNAVIIFKYEK